MTMNRIVALVGMLIVSCAVLSEPVNCPGLSAKDAEIRKIEADGANAMKAALNALQKASGMSSSQMSSYALALNSRPELAKLQTARIESVTKFLTSFSSGDCEKIAVAKGSMKEAVSVQWKATLDAIQKDMSKYGKQKH
jgi:hypothetical protein